MTAQFRFTHKVFVVTSSLKPVGLNFLLNTNCGVLQGRRRAEHHRKRSGLHSYGKTLPARQCKLSGNIWLVMTHILY